MGNTNKNLNKEILANFSGQETILTIPKLYIKITGTHERALVLNQIIFFSNKSELKGEWFWKSYQEWYQEILIPEKTLRRIFIYLQESNLIIKKTNQIRGKRVLLIKPNFEQIMLLIEDHLSQTAILSGSVDNDPEVDQELPQTDNLAGTEIAPNGQNGRLQTDKMAVSIYTDDFFSDEKNKHTCMFDLFWERYPVKKARAKSKEIWNRKKLDSCIDLILEAISNQQANDHHWVNGYIPNPTTYLNQERWTDEIKPSQDSIKKQQREKAAQETKKRLEEQARFSEEARQRELNKHQEYNQDRKIMNGIRSAVKKGSGYEQWRKENKLKNKED